MAGNRKVAVKGLNMYASPIATCSGPIFGRQRRSTITAPSPATESRSVCTSRCETAGPNPASRNTADTTLSTVSNDGFASPSPRLASHTERYLAKRPAGFQSNSKLVSCT